MKINIFYLISFSFLLHSNASLWSALPNSNAANDSQSYTHDLSQSPDLGQNTISPKELTDCLAEECAAVNAPKDYPVVLFVGGVGSGKTTTVTHLLGYEMGYDTDEGCVIVKDPNVPQNLKIGHEISTSCTRGSHIFLNEKYGFYLADTEGFLGVAENATLKERVRSQISPTLLLHLNKIKGIVFVVSYAEIEAMRGDVFDKIHKAFFSLLGKKKPGLLAPSIRFLITKAQKFQEGTVKSNLRKFIQRDYLAYEKEVNGDANNAAIGWKKSFWKPFLKKQPKKLDDLKEFILNEEMIIFHSPIDFNTFKTKSPKSTLDKLNKLKGINKDFLVLPHSDLIKSLGGCLVKKATVLMKDLGKLEKYQSDNLKKLIKEKEDEIEALQENETSYLIQRSECIVPNPFADYKPIGDAADEGGKTAKFITEKVGYDGICKAVGDVTGAVAGASAVVLSKTGAATGIIFYPILTLVGVATLQPEVVVVGAAFTMGSYEILKTPSKDIYNEVEEGVNSLVRGTCTIPMGVLGAATGLAEFTARGAYNSLSYAAKGRIKKTFVYTNQTHPNITKLSYIECVYRNGALSHSIPENILADKFSIRETEINRSSKTYKKLILRVQTEPNLTEYRINYRTYLGKDADCTIKLYVKVKDLESTQYLIAEKQQEILELNTHKDKRTYDKAFKRLLQASKYVGLIALWNEKLKHWNFGNGRLLDEFVKYYKKLHPKHQVPLSTMLQGKKQQYKPFMIDADNDDIKEPEDEMKSQFNDE